MTIVSIDRSKWVPGIRFSLLGLAAIAVACLVLSMTGGCTSLGLKQPEPAWVKADRATYDIIAPRFEAYVIADSKLAAADKQSLTDLLRDWQFRLLEAEKAVGP